MDVAPVLSRVQVASRGGVISHRGYAGRTVPTSPGHWRLRNIASFLFTIEDQGVRKAIRQAGRRLNPLALEHQLLSFNGKTNMGDLEMAENRWLTLRKHKNPENSSKDEYGSGPRCGPQVMMAGRRAGGEKSKNEFGRRSGDAGHSKIK